MNKYRYILIGDSRGRNYLNKTEDSGQQPQAQPKQQLQLSGLYQWANCFQKHGKGGTIDSLWRLEDLEDYDIVHVNMTPSNLQLLSTIRSELGESSSTKIVCNVDLDVSHWSVNYSYYLTQMMSELKKADILFHVESQGALVLRHMMDREVKVCPHPVDVSLIYDHIKKERNPMAGVIFHRYTGESLMPYLALRNVPLRRVLLGYTPIGKQAAVANAGMYDDILQYQNFTSHIDELAKMFVGCDMYSGYSYGRAPVEMAALAVPVVGSNTIEAMNRLFPDTCVHPFDTKRAEELFMRLIQDPDFADSVIKKAAEGCKYYGIENSYKRFCELIEN